MPARDAALRAWYASPVGERLLDGLQARLEDLLSCTFGYHALLVGDIAPQRELLGASRINHRIYMDADRGAGLLGRAEELPIQSDSLDLVLLVHRLEFSAEPHQVLREVERTLIPEGHVVIVGFNPLGCYGLWKLALGWRGRMPWRGRFYTRGRLKDWLALLGFELLECEYLGFRPPVGRTRLLDRLEFVERLGGYAAPYLGGIYVLLAQKHLTTFTPIRPRWRPRRLVVANGLAGPSARRYKDLSV